MITNVHLFDSNLKNESRLLKETEYVVREKLINKVLVFGVWNEGLLINQKIDEARTFLRFKLPLHTIDKNRLVYRNFILRKWLVITHYISFRYQIFRNLLHVSPTYISVHNPSLLSIAFLARPFTKSKIIYVPHELEPHRTGLGIVGKVMVPIIELFARYGLKYTVVVSPRIEKWYRENLGYRSISTVRNIPIHRGEHVKKPGRSKILKHLFEIDENSILFIYQGIIDESRGIDLLLDVFASQKRCHIVFMGFGSMCDEVIKMSEKCPYIHYHTAVPMDHIIEHTSSADISLMFVDQPMSLSYRLTTANKFYEGIIAGTPFLISSNFEYMSEENLRNDLGWVLNPDRHSLENFVSTITLEQIAQKKKQCSEYAKVIGWDNEATVFKSIYV